MLRIFILTAAVFLGGCWGGGLFDLLGDGDIDVGFPVEFHGGIEVHGQAVFDDLTAEQIEVIGSVGVNNNGSTLTATIYSTTPPEDGIFRVGQDVKMTVIVEGGSGPSFELDCQWPDADFTHRVGGPVFNFKSREPLSAKPTEKVVNLPGNGILSCQITGGNEQTVGVWFPIKVE